MLENLAIDQACFIVTTARGFHAKAEGVAPDSASNMGDDRAIEILADTEEDPTFAEIQGVLAALNQDARDELLALMWLGRGDFDIAEWSSALDQARTFETPDLTTYLLQHPLLADYLEEGLAEHGLSCLEEESGHL